MSIYQNSDSLPAQEADPITIRLFHLFNTQQWVEFDKLYNTLLQQSSGGDEIATAILNNKNSKNRNFTELYRLTTPLIKTAFYELWLNRLLIFSFALALMAFYSINFIGVLITSILFVPLAVISLARAIFLLIKTKGNNDLGIQAENPWPKFTASIFTLFASLMFVLNCAAISSISSIFTFTPLILFIGIAIEFAPIVAAAFEKKASHLSSITFLSLIAMYFALAAIFPGLDVIGFALPLAMAALATILLIHNYDSNNSNATAWQNIVTAKILPELGQDLAAIRISIQEQSENTISVKANTLIALKTRIDTIQRSISELSGTVTKNTAQQLQALRTECISLSNIIVQQLITPLSNQLAQIQAQDILIPSRTINQASSTSSATAIDAKGTLENMRDALAAGQANLQSLNPLLKTLEQAHLPVTAIRREYNRLLHDFTTKLSSVKLTIDRVIQFVTGYQELNKHVSKIATQNLEQLDFKQLESLAQELRNTERSQIQTLNRILSTLAKDPQMQHDNSFTENAQHYCNLKAQIVELQERIFQEILAKTNSDLRAIDNSDRRLNILKYQIERAEFLQWTYQNTARGIVNKSYESNANSSFVQANKNEIAKFTNVPSSTANALKLFA